MLQFAAVALAVTHFKIVNVLDKFWGARVQSIF